jgi:cytochrome c556
MFKLKTALAAGLVLATTGFALAYSTNPDVQKRQETMGLIGANLKKLAPMAQGKADFDAAAAQAAFAALANLAGSVPVVFEPKTTDPQSKASSDIWDHWEDFTAKAAALEAAAKAGATVDSPEALQAAFGPMAGACKACHSQYKN